MSSIMIGLFAALFGLLAGYILSGIFPKFWLKLVMDDCLKEADERLDDVDHTLSEFDKRISKLEVVDRMGEDKDISK